MFFFLVQKIIKIRSPGNRKKWYLLEYRTRNLQVRVGRQNEPETSCQKILRFFVQIFDKSLFLYQFEVAENEKSNICKWPLPVFQENQFYIPENL